MRPILTFSHAGQLVRVMISFTKSCCVHTDNSIGGRGRHASFVQSIQPDEGVFRLQRKPYQCDEREEEGLVFYFVCFFINIHPTCVCVCVQKRKKKL